MKKDKKPGRVRRQKLHVVDSPVRKTKKREFWSLFSNVKNHKFQDIMRKGNYLDDLIKIIEDLSEEQFAFLFDDTKTLSVTLRELKLEQYDEEIKHLCKLIALSKNSKPVPEARTVKDFYERINLAPDTIRHLKKEHNFAPPEITDVAAIEVDLENTGTVLDVLDPVTLDRVTEMAALMDVDPMEALLGIAPLAPRPSLKNILESDANAERRRIQETYSLKAEAETKSAKVEVVETSPQAVVYSTPAKPQFLVDVEQARALLDKFDNEYAKRQCAVVTTKKQMKEEKQRWAKTPSNHVYATSLDPDTKAYLKAQREFDMIKRIWEQARAAFKDTKIEEVDTVMLANEIQKLAKFDINHIFDDMHPSKELHDKEMARRGSHGPGNKRATGPWPFEEKQKVRSEITK